MPDLPVLKSIFGPFSEQKETLSHGVESVSIAPYIVLFLLYSHCCCKSGRALSWCDGCVLWYGRADCESVIAVGCWISFYFRLLTHAGSHNWGIIMQRMSGEDYCPLFWQRCFHQVTGGRTLYVCTSVRVLAHRPRLHLSCKSELRLHHCQRVQT